MNPRLRVALALVPVLSLGLLSWLPLLYLYVRDPHCHRRVGVHTVVAFACTALLVACLLIAEPGSFESKGYAVLYLWFIVGATLLAWVDSRPQAAPVKDPYA